MSVNLAHHLKVSRHGIYYFRMRVPDALRSAFGKREILHSLQTRDPAKARKLAYTFTSKTYALFESMAYDPKRFNPNDPSTFPTKSGGDFRRYELDLSRGIMKSDGAEDHARMMEAIGVLKSMPAPAPTPPSPVQYVEPQPEHTITLSKALDDFLPTMINDRTRNTYKRFIKQFIEHRGDVEIHTVRGVDVVTWNAKLQKTISPKTKKKLDLRTVDNAIQALQSLLSWAKDNEYIHEDKKLATNKKSNLTKSTRDENNEGAEPFSVEQLVQIFNPETYEAYCVNDQTHEYSLSRKWMPLIALHTGMRKEEIAQLRNTDIITEQESGVHYIDINRLGGKSTKNKKSSIRRIPIHDTLIRLGFMDFVKTRSSKLFSETGNAVSHAFIRYILMLGVKKDMADRAMVFHSFRDTFNNKLAIPTVPERLRYALMGHSMIGDTNAKNYTKAISALNAKEWGIDKLDFVETVAGNTYRLVL